MGDMEGGSQTVRELSKDPDYSSFHKTTQDNVNRREEFVKKEETIQRIKSVIQEQFTLEIRLKEQELMKIDQRIHQARDLLDRLRAYILAAYFGSGGTILPVVSVVPPKKGKIDSSSASNDKDEVLPSYNAKEYQPDQSTGTTGIQGTQNLASAIRTVQSSDSFQKLSTASSQITSTGQLSSIPDNGDSSRFYVAKSVIIGNVSKYIPIDRREKNDQSSHKWMVYVRGPKDKPDVSKFIRKVVFFLHPSYIPNDIVEVTKPPFQLTRRGWGEFPVRLQLHFVDSRNKKVDVFHHLKLDKTYTGLQTLGAETVVDLQLHRHSVLDAENQQATSGSKATNVLSAGNGGIKDPLPLPKSFIVGSESISTNDSSINLQQILTVNKNVDSYPPSRDGASQFGDILQGTPSERDTASFICSEPSSVMMSRATSPLTLDGSQKSPMFHSSTDALLGKCADQLPLMKSGRDRSILHFTARSAEEYKKWSFSKRRAAEWQRASQMKRELNKISDNTFDMTTKDIYIWCRNSGYTPSELDMMVYDAEEADFCPVCGKVFKREDGRTSRLSEISWCSKCVGKANFPRFDVLSPSSSLMEIIDVKDKILKKLGPFSGKGENQSDDDDDEIDVVTVPATSTANSVKNSMETLGKITEIPSSAEMDWVYDTSSEVGVHLPAVYENGYRIPMLQGMLLAGMKEFVKDLLRLSNREGKRKKKTFEPMVLTTAHVHKAILCTERMDFLSTAHLTHEIKGEYEDSAYKKE